MPRPPVPRQMSGVQDKDGGDGCPIFCRRRTASLGLMETYALGGKRGRYVCAVGASDGGGAGGRGVGCGESGRMDRGGDTGTANAMPCRRRRRRTINQFHPAPRVSNVFRLRMAPSRRLVDSRLWWACSFSLPSPFFFCPCSTTSRCAIVACSMRDVGSLAHPLCKTGNKEKGRDWKAGKRGRGMRCSPLLGLRHQSTSVCPRVGQCTAESESCLLPQWRTAGVGMLHAGCWLLATRIDAAFSRMRTAWSERRGEGGWEGAQAAVGRR
ncbi:hypothetical protein BS50DRAFT_409972 [Corynespora cassiicola Philippines]|uniref:Uncharacterized protein n=1 Tax=Corynespora cassiicola Philippines TaxID=1448308 RepID=A0A2T2NLH9_CORCC|nr:hypothetical protein BS50DRAFT_409972 [Corynespora cassiicola Philippines]